MSLEKIADRIYECDVLVAGAGVGGAPLATRAVEQGLSVLCIEKSNAARCGNAAHGMDHYGVFPHGVSVQELVTMWQNSRHRGVVNGKGTFVNPNLDYVLTKNVFPATEHMESWGVPMAWTDDGKWYWTPHQIHQKGLRLGIRVHWERVKQITKKIMIKKGVTVLDRVMMIDLLKSNDKVVGMTALDTRTGEFIVIKAKATSIATGMFCRCYDPEGPLNYKYKMLYHYCPATTSGDGWAAAYRAGVGLAHMDLASWGFRVRDHLTVSFGSFVSNDGIPSKVFDWKGREIPNLSAITPQGYDKLEREGNLPIYQSLEHLPPDYQKRLEVAYADEYFFALKMAGDRGFNPAHHRWEFMKNKPLQFMLLQGLYVGEKMESTMKGLYAIGDAAVGVGGCHGAVTSAYVLGNNLPTFVQENGEPDIDLDQVQRQKEAVYAPMKVKSGHVEPMELECAIRYICETYIGTFKSEGKLREGMRRLRTLKRDFLPRMAAKNPHYLMRAMEVRNIMDLVEVHFAATFERKETRGSYIRLDYPEMDTSRDGFITLSRLKDGEPILEKVELPDMNPEYMKEGA